MTAKPIYKFNARLDDLLGLTPGSSRADHPKIDPMLEVAETLNKIDFDSELSPRAGIDARWRGQLQRFKLAQPLSIARLIWVPFVIVLVALLAVFHQPVFAAVSRAFGYIFVQDVGFVPADSTFLLKQPILQEHNGQSVTVRQGVATPQNIILFLEFNDVARPADGAGLETVSGETIKLLQWEYFPNTPGSHGIKMIFSSLPVGTTQTILSLPEGWHLPLEWIPASRAKLPDARVVPYISTTQESTASWDLCVEKHGVNLCVLAATTSPENTSVLVETGLTNPSLQSSWMGPIWQDGVLLKDEQGNAAPLERQEGETLVFPPLSSAGQKVTLVVPALLADVDLTNQNIVVDLGADPGPDTVIPLDASIQVLGMVVHFSQATFVGDGVNSLRLTLNADEPIPNADGITPLSFDLGKPDRVDDLYGSGMLEGSKDIFIELVRPNGKITGVLTIPIVRATVRVEGPFEFTFNLTTASSSTPVPAEADPNAFFPAPTPTALPLDSYFFSGQTLETGDLLYAVWNGRQTDVYRFTPSTSIDHGLFLTLPRHVSSINIHPDKQGIDYLTGIYNKDTNVLDDPHLYTLRFVEPNPRLLTLTPPGVLLPFQLAWSPDGHILAFNVALNAPAAMGTVGWIDLSCRETGECPITILNNPTGNAITLSDSAFSQNSKWLALNGADSESGAGEIFILPVDNNHLGEIYNLSQTRWSADSTYSWISDDTLVWICESGDAGNPTSSLCMKKVAQPASSPEVIFSFNDWQYFGMAPDGKYFWQVVINRQVEREQQIWLHDRVGSGKLLTAAPMFNLDYGKPAFSMDGQYLAYTSTTDSFKTAPDTLYVINTTTGQQILTYEINQPVGWLGWVH
jgi:WD40 repeat protein